MAGKGLSRNDYARTHESLSGPSVNKLNPISVQVRHKRGIQERSAAPPDTKHESVKVEGKEIPKDQTFGAAGFGGGLRTSMIANEDIFPGVTASN